MHQNVFTLLVSFAGSYSKDEPNFPQENKLFFTENQGAKKVSFTACQSGKL